MAGQLLFLVLRLMVETFALFLVVTWVVGLERSLCLGRDQDDRVSCG